MVSESVPTPEGSGTTDGIRLSGAAHIRLSGMGRFTTCSDGIIRVVPVEAVDEVVEG